MTTSNSDGDGSLLSGLDVPGLQHVCTLCSHGAHVVSVQDDNDRVRSVGADPNRNDFVIEMSTRLLW